ncbi:hypothetical protein [Promicromonospora soli]|uniref:Uncharacterized protein n=1 Tax=Promicromonospora soli TaxID=2035533 RepID=A0A919KZP8_9MICO|nr:hypothetical protein [Promicromonospora soli]GHH78054.1 hypothetical protein GCM10017772_40680 [Promicromonospora soli]
MAVHRRAPGRALRIGSLLVALAVAVAIGGVASAFWSFGSGTGAGTTGSTTPVTLSPGMPAAALYPDGQTDVVLTVANPNPSDVVISSLGLDEGQGEAGFAVDVGHSGCAVSALSYTPQTNGGSGWTVPARVGAVDGALSITLPAALAMSPDAADACQGANITVYLEAGP